MIRTGATVPYRVNLGCGARRVRSWVNIDMIATGDDVIAHDLSKGIPLPDKSAEIVYHSHVLEHIPRENAPAFIRECFRVLAPGGVLRVAVPDLERIVRTYIAKLEGAVRGDEAAAHDYDWIMLELLDQAVRNKPGGGMHSYLGAPDLKNARFVVERIGEEGAAMIHGLQNPGTVNPAVVHSSSARWRNLPGRITNLARRIAARVFLGRKGSRIFAVGAMRVSGEVHQWMYDRYSLGRLLESAGFRDVVVQSAGSSKVPGWAELNLDTNASGEPVKPDSLFVEAVRPMEG